MWRNRFGRGFGLVVWQITDDDDDVDRCAANINRLTPNDSYMGRTTPLTSKRCILYIYSTNISTEYFKHAIYSPFFSLQNAVCFIMLTCLAPVLFTFYIQDVLKLKKNNSGAKGLKKLKQLIRSFRPNRKLNQVFLLHERQHQIAHHSANKRGDVINCADCSP